MPNPTDDDSMRTRSSLLHQVRSPEATAWEEFDRVYRPFLEEQARLAGLRATDAQDVTQEVLIELQQRLAEFQYERGRCRFRSWILGRLKWRVADHYRRQGRQPPFVPTTDETGTGLLDRVPAPDAPSAAGGDAEWAANLLRAAEAAAQRGASPRDWQIYRYLEDNKSDAGDCDYAGAARDLGINRAYAYVVRGRVGRRVATELRRLRETME